MPPSQCLGETPDGQDFDAFVGVEKAKEIKGLFSSWIDTIFRTLNVMHYHPHIAGIGTNLYTIQPKINGHFLPLSRG